MAAAHLQMLTANRLVDGDVVYWRAGGWVETFGEGDVFAAEAEAEAALDAARKFVAGNAVVNPYLFDVRADADGVHPVKEREIIRAAGPSVRADLGKQANDLTSPLWGGRSVERSEDRSGGGSHSMVAPHPARKRSPTSPQGGGERNDDVSL